MQLHSLSVIGHRRPFGVTTCSGLTKSTPTSGLRRAQLAALGWTLSCVAITSVAGAQNQVWIRQFGTDARDQARGSVSDGVGGAFVCGQTGGNLGAQNAGSSDAWIGRFDSAGNQTWMRQLGSSAEDVAWAVAPDPSGGVYVSGHTFGLLGNLHAGSSDAWLARYDGAGNWLWTRQFGTSSEDIAYAATPDGAGGVYVSGSTTGSLQGVNSGAKDVWLARYDRFGNQTWIQQFGTANDDAASSAASDPAGGVYVTGSTLGGLGGPHAGGQDVWIARYNDLGNRTWIQHFGWLDHDYAHAAAADADGVYVCGVVHGIFSGPNGGTGDAWLARYNRTGIQNWIQYIGANGADAALAVACDTASGVFVSGTTWGSIGALNVGLPDAWLARYDGAGIRSWIEQFGTSGDDVAIALAPDQAGGVLATGWTFGSLGGTSFGEYDFWLSRFDPLVSERYCPQAIFNSTGQFGSVYATGSNQIVSNNVTLGATRLPENSFGYFNTSRDQGNTPVPNSQGQLCLGGAIGRFVGPGQIKNSGSTGSFTLEINLNAMPHPISPVVVQPGQTWHFQAWYRDANPTSTSNFTDAVSVTFL
jgi:hypothetical protein